MKQLLVAFICLLSVTFTACADHDTPIEFSQLPKVAQDFSNKHFGTDEIIFVVYDSELGDKEYKITYRSGAEVKFDKAGEWKSVEFEKGSIPQAIVPAAILKTIQSKHPNSTITKISKERKTIDVELNDQLEMVFNKAGKFLRYDD